MDVIAFVARTCYDQGLERNLRLVPDSAGPSVASPTSIAVSSNRDELCSRNLVHTGYKLLQNYLSTSTASEKNIGYHLLYLIISSFMTLNNDDDATAIGERQVENIIKACKFVIENPLLLFQGGKTYHMVTNTAIMLCHYLNGIHARSHDSSRNIDTSLFDDALDTFLAVRTLLVAHRKKIPQILRCHGIPRPSILQLYKRDSQNGIEKPLIDLGETFMCSCRGCQGFVLFGCSPCVAGEGSQVAQNEHLNASGPFYGGDVNEFDDELKEIGKEFDLDDDVLLDILGKIISS